MVCLYLGLPVGPWALWELGPASTYCSLVLGKYLMSSRYIKFAEVDWIDVRLAQFINKHISRIHHFLWYTSLETSYYLLSATGNGRKEIWSRNLVWVFDNLKLETWPYLSCWWEQYKPWKYTFNKGCLGCQFRYISICNWCI